MAKKHRIAGIFFNYAAPWMTGFAFTILFVLLSIPAETEERNKRLAVQGEAIYCSELIDTKKVREDDGFTEFRCFKEAKK